MEYKHDCSIIIVNYNGKHFLKNCLDSVVRETKTINAEIYLVDNNSDDGSYEFVENNYNQVKIIGNKKNVGFAAANNQAINICSGKYIFLLNPDTVMLENSLKGMLFILDKEPNVGAVACKILNPDGSLQFSVGNFPKFLNQIMECFFLHRLFPRIKISGGLVLDRRFYEKRNEIDWALGAVLIVRRDVLFKAGGLDSNYFFGSEERDLCYQIRKFGLKIVYIPDVEIVHHGKGWRMDTTIDKELVRGRIRFVRKNYGKIKALIYHLIIVLHLSIRSLIWMMLSIIKKDKKQIVKQRRQGYILSLKACIKEFTA